MAKDVGIAATDGAEPRGLRAHDPASDNKSYALRLRAQVLLTRVHGMVWDNRRAFADGSPMKFGATEFHVLSDKISMIADKIATMDDDGNAR